MKNFRSGVRVSLINSDSELIEKKVKYIQLQKVIRAGGD